jgi:hypothetical protein
MGIFTEVAAESRAEDFEDILINAIKEWEMNEHDPTVVQFCKKHVYPKYLYVLADAFRGKPTNNQLLIEKFYKNI